MTAGLTRWSCQKSRLHAVAPDKLYVHTYLHCEAKFGTGISRKYMTKSSDALAPCSRSCDVSIAGSTAEQERSASLLYVVQGSFTVCL